MKTSTSFLLAVLVPLAALTAACSKSEDHLRPHRSTTTSSTKPATPITTPSLVVGGKSYLVPTENGGALPGLGQSSGTQIVVTRDGVLPSVLLAKEGDTITWTNLSPHPVKIHFLTGGIKDSGLLATGESFTYSTPGRYNFAFKTSSGHEGTVYVGAFTGVG